MPPAAARARLQPARRSPYRNPAPHAQCPAQRTRRAARGRARHHRAPEPRLQHPITRPAPLLPLPRAPAWALQAGPVTVYQCTEPYGSITVQTSGPCAEGRPQRIRVVDAPPPVTLRPPAVEGRLLQPSQLPVLRAGAERAGA